MEYPIKILIYENKGEDEECINFYETELCIDEGFRYIAESYDNKNLQVKGVFRTYSKQHGEYLSLIHI